MERAMNELMAPKVEAAALLLLLLLLLDVVLPLDESLEELLLEELESPEEVELLLAESEESAEVPLEVVPLLDDPLLDDPVLDEEAEEEVLSEPVELTLPKTLPSTALIELQSPESSVYLYSEPVE